MYLILEIPETLPLNTSVHFVHPLVIGNRSLYSSLIVVLIMIVMLHENGHDHTTANTTSTM